MIEARVKNALQKRAKRENTSYELLFDKSIDVLGKKVADYIITEFILGDMSTQDLYVTYRRKEYVVEASVVDIDEVTEVGLSAKTLVNYINEYGNYDDEEEYREENNFGIRNWENFKK